MTSPLVKPHGYSGLSKLDNVSLRPPAFTVTRRPISTGRSGPVDVGAVADAGRSPGRGTRTSVGAQATPGGVPQASLAASELPEPDFPDQHRAHPSGACDVLAWRDLRERVGAAFQRREAVAQLVTVPPGEARADIADVDHLTGAGVVRAE